MKILVFSDTHGWDELLVETAKALLPADAVFFLGDGISDAEALQTNLPKLPIYSVIGNCDFDLTQPSQGLVPFDGVLFFYTHGHLFAAKSTTKLLLNAAKNCGASIALYGHTHAPHYHFQEGVHLFNPGSLALPRSGAPSYGIITIENSTPSFEIKYL